MSHPCPLCGATTRLALTAPDHRLGRPQQHEVWLCDDCGLGHTQPPLSAEERQAAYPPAYKPYQTVTPSVSGPRARLAASVLTTQGYPQPNPLPLPSFLAHPLAGVRSWTWQPPPPPPGRLLDVGCGSGTYGASLLRLGWEVDGIEPDERATERARSLGMNIQNCDLLDAALPPHAYNVITLWHVLEHVDDPVAALAHLYRTLRPGGQLLVEVPNREGLPARLAGSYWFHLDLPRHRLHFTPKSLRLMLEQAGFRVKRIRHIPNPHGLTGAFDYHFGTRVRWTPPAQGLGWLTGMAAATLQRSDIIRATATTP